ncbi:MAG: ABC transporter permease [Candidatus Hadarchaeales archaeon]
MSELKKLKTVVKYELLKQVRRRRFYGALGITVLAVALMIGLYHGLDIPARMNIPSMFIDRYGAEVFSIFTTSMSALAVIGAVFFSGDAIASEYEQKTGYILFPNPVKKTTIVVGKYIACLIATSSIILTAYLISASSTLAFYGRIPVGVLGSLAIALVLGCMVISLAFLFSSALKGGMGATIATLLTYMVVFSIISGTLSYAGYDPWFMPDRAGDSLASTYGIPLNELAGGVYGGGRWISGMIRASQDPGVSFAVLAFYAIVFLVAAVWLAKRREMV